MRIREPFNGASHLVGLLLACAGTGILLRWASNPWEVAAFTIYGAQLVNIRYHQGRLDEMVPLMRDLGRATAKVGRRYRPNDRLQLVS